MEEKIPEWGKVLIESQKVLLERVITLIEAKEKKEEELKEEEEAHREEEASAEECNRLFGDINV